MNSEIEAKRKEFEDNMRDFKKINYNVYKNNRLMLLGFNLGVEMARKEFLDFLDYLWKSGCVDELAVRNKIVELKLSLGEKK